MNLNENIRKEWKFVEKLRLTYLQFMLISYLINTLEYETYHKINAKT